MIVRKDAVIQMAFGSETCKSHPGAGREKVFICHLFPVVSSSMLHVGCNAFLPHTMAIRTYIN